MKQAPTGFVVILLVMCILFALAGCQKDPSGTSTPSATVPSIDYSKLDFNMSFEGIKRGNVSSRATVHDPSIFKWNGTYYIFGSHMDSGKGTNLKDWTQMSAGVNRANPVFGKIYDVFDQAFAWAGAPSSTVPTDNADQGGEHVWAPDVIYNKAMGKFVMYYCTTSTWNASNLCYAISDSPEGPYEWQGALIYSGFTKSNIDKTNVLDVVSEDYANEHYYRGGGKEYNYRTCPNAIDPSVFYDNDGKMWMVYGSWSGGIFILELDESTGLPIHPEADPDNDVDPYFGKRLLGGDHKSIEGPYILRTENYYYLFVSYGALNRDGGYQMRVFRSENPDGPYVDMNGKTPYGAGHAAFGLKLSGNYNLPSLAFPYKATGHNSALVDDDGKMYVVYHTRFDNGTETHKPRVHQLLLNKEGWPCMLPYQTRGETVSDYTADQVVGRYYMINQGTAIDDVVAQPVILYLLEGGAACTRDAEGTWTIDGHYMTVTLGGKTYSGVFCAMPDEGGTDCMTFSAVGSNESVWGVKYD